MSKWLKQRTVLHLIYFYPKADTPGCTAQSCAVRDALPNPEELGVAALGISSDLPAKQGKFDRKYTLGFPPLSGSRSNRRSAGTEASCVRGA